jgi:hypothetical protein
MMAQLSPMLAFDPSTIPRLYADEQDYFRSIRRRRRPWSFGRITNSLRGIYALGGGTTRTPGRYRAVDPDNESEHTRPLRDTCEYVHSSVRTRFALRGPGVEDEGEYDADALMRGWRLVVTYPDGERGKPNVFWRARRGEEGRRGFVNVLPECPLWEEERRLLGYDESMEEEVMSPPPTRRE